MKIKKVLSVALATAMVATMLTGCGGGKDDTTPAPSDDQAAPVEQETEPAADDTADAEAPAASGDVVTINLTRNSFNVANPDSAQVKKVEDAINEYIKDKINVQITLTDIGSGEYADKTNLALANGELNLFWTASWQGTVGTNDLYASNAAYDLTDLLPGTPLYESMDAGQWEAAKYDGKKIGRAHV